MQGLITSFTRSAAGAEKVFSLWDNAPDIDPTKGESVDWEVEGKLELKGVKFWYQMRPDNIVLDGLNLVIEAGKTVALVGRSGGGKSTIINMLLRFYDAKEGVVELDGFKYEGLRVNELRRLFGVVSQDTELFAKSIADNISYGMEEGSFTREDVEDAARRAQCYDFIMEMKDGFETRVGERGGRISGGQRQRIAIARVFLRKPKIILLDEATSALDENSQEAVQKSMDRLIKESGATVVLVAHRLSTVMGADKIVVVEGGGVLEEGSHNELVKLGGVYKSLVEKGKKREENKLKEGEEGEGGGGKGKGEVDNIDALFK